MISTREIVCRTPPTPSPTVSSLRLRIDGAEVDVGFTFSFDAPPPIHDIQPRSGPQAGGTSVLVLGRLFTASPALFCRFGDMHTPTALESTERLTCITPPVAMTGNVTFELVRGPFGPTVYADYFEFEPSTMLFALTPDRGPREGGSRMIISGEAFSYRAARLGMLQCRFNTTNVVAEFISTRTIACITPAHAPGATSVEVTSNLQQYTSSGLAFTFEAVALTAVYPTHGPVRGGSFTAVSVVFATPPLRDSLSCLFDADNTVDASFDATGRVVCLSPPVASASAVVLTISSSHAVFTSALLFTYEPEPVLGSLFPVMGPTRGGTVIAIFGEGFLASESMWCRFTVGGEAAFGGASPEASLVPPGSNGTSPHALMVPARRISSSHLECTSPVAPAAYATVQLTFNGEEPCSEDALIFQFNPVIALHAIVPPRGTVSGGVPMHIYGSGFSRRAAEYGYLRCKFGNVTSVATLSDDAKELICMLPRSKPGFVSLEVSNNMVDFSRGSSLWFEYVTTKLVEVLPDNGPIAGGTVITVQGSGFIGSQIYGTQCYFGETAVEGLFISSSKVLCVTPSHESDVGAHTSQLSLRLSGRQTIDTLPYHFLTTLMIETAHPLVGPVQGGTTVVVDGRYFSANSFCKFANAVVPAHFVSTKRIQCAAPAHPVGKVEVSISSNNQNFFGVQDQFEYTPSASIATIFPDRGPTDGGTFVSVFGSDYHERSASLFYLTCRFNITAVPAVFISPTEVKCYTPEVSSLALHSSPWTPRFGSRA